MSPWALRRGRALALATERSHAAEMLRCYADVTVAQERIGARVPMREWTSAASSGGADGPVLRLSTLPAGDLLALFDAFLSDLTEVGTEVMKASRDEIAAASPSARTEHMEKALTPAPFDEGPDRFHSRAFVEATATTLAGRVLPAADPPVTEGPTRCRVCDAPPIVATLRDLPGALGSRSVVCCRCSYEQRLRRLTCVSCGEAKADRLSVHTAESLPHVRIDECSSCGHYIKTIDLRRRGDAVPIVEDLATPELDLWAADRGLTKGRKNLFGL